MVKIRRSLRSTSSSGGSGGSGGDRPRAKRILQRVNDHRGMFQLAGWAVFIWLFSSLAANQVNEHVHVLDMDLEKTSVPKHQQQNQQHLRRGIRMDYQQSPAARAAAGSTSNKTPEFHSQVQVLRHEEEDEKSTSTTSASSSRASFTLATKNIRLQEEEEEPETDRSKWEACQGHPTMDVEFSNPADFTIVMSTSIAFLDFFQNWWNYFEQLKIGHKVNLVVLAEDDEVHSKLRKMKLPKESVAVLRTAYSLPPGLNTDRIRQEGYSYGSSLLHRLMVTRPERLLSLACSPILNAKNLVFTDVDTVWLNNPIPHIKAHLQQFDLVAQIDNTDTMEYCAGFMGLQVNQVIANLLRQWHDELARGYKRANLPEGADQTILNNLLNRKESTVRHDALPKLLFPSGRIYFDKEETTDMTRSLAVVVHNNWMNGHANKKSRFHQFGLWSLSDPDEEVMGPPHAGILAAYNIAKQHLQDKQDELHKKKKKKRKKANKTKEGETELAESGTEPSEALRGSDVAETPKKSLDKLMKELKRRKKTKEIRTDSVLTTKALGESTTADAEKKAKKKKKKKKRRTVEDSDTAFLSSKTSIELTTQSALDIAEKKRKKRERKKEKREQGDAELKLDSTSALNEESRTVTTRNRKKRTKTESKKEEDDEVEAGVPSRTFSAADFDGPNEGGESDDSGFVAKRVIDASLSRRSSSLKDDTSMEKGAFQAALSTENSDAKERVDKSTLTRETTLEDDADTRLTKTASSKSVAMAASEGYRYERDGYHDEVDEPTDPLRNSLAGARLSASAVSPSNIETASTLQKDVREDDELPVEDEEDGIDRSYAGGNSRPTLDTRADDKEQLEQDESNDSRTSPGTLPTSKQPSRVASPSYPISAEERIANDLLSPARETSTFDLEEAEDHERIGTKTTGLSSDPDQADKAETMTIRIGRKTSRRKVKRSSDLEQEEEDERLGPRIGRKPSSTKTFRTAELPSDLEQADEEEEAQEKVGARIDHKASSTKTSSLSRQKLHPAEPDDSEDDGDRTAIEIVHKTTKKITKAMSPQLLHHPEHIGDSTTAAASTAEKMGKQDYGSQDATLNLRPAMKTSIMDNPITQLKSAAAVEDVTSKITSLLRPGSDVDNEGPEQSTSNASPSKTIAGEPKLALATSTSNTNDREADEMGDEEDSIAMSLEREKRPFMLAGDQLSFGTDSKVTSNIPYNVASPLAAEPNSQDGARMTTKDRLDPDSVDAETTRSSARVAAKATEEEEDPPNEEENDDTQKALLKNLNEKEESAGTELDSGFHAKRNEKLPTNATRASRVGTTAKATAQDKDPDEEENKDSSDTRKALLKNLKGPLSRQEFSVPEPDSRFSGFHLTNEKLTSSVATSRKSHEFTAATTTKKGTGTDTSLESHEYETGDSMNTFSGSKTLASVAQLKAAFAADLASSTSTLKKSDAKLNPTIPNKRGSETISEATAAKKKGREEDLESDEFEKEDSLDTPGSSNTLPSSAKLEERRVDADLDSKLSTSVLKQRDSKIASSLPYKVGSPTLPASKTTRLTDKDSLEEDDEATI